MRTLASFVVGLLWGMPGLIAWAPLPATAAAASPDAAGAEIAARAVSRASAAVIGVAVKAVDGARSAATLGGLRQGSGVVIGADGLVLTIGYLVVEAELIELQPDDGRHVPARLVAYDQATGFGLVQALVPLRLEPVALGRSGQLRDDEPLIVVSGGDAGSVGIARLASQRAFSGYWEYHIDDAIFTTPPRPHHSGAALFNVGGELLGIGSLRVADATGSGHPGLPGNMFVPVDLLKPVLAELRESGSSRASARAWIGVNCIEKAGVVEVVQVSRDGPAEGAGLRAGDHIVGIGDTPVGALAQLWQALWSGGAAERAVTLRIVRDGEPRTVVVQAVDRARTLRRADGV